MKGKIMSNALVEFYREFPVEEHDNRADRLRMVLESQGLDAVLLTHEPNIRWLTGCHIQSY
jgi:Xaa-Pro aminopeptidase